MCVKTVYKLKGIRILISLQVNVTPAHCFFLWNLNPGFSLESASSWAPPRPIQSDYLDGAQAALAFQISQASLTYSQGWKSLIE